MRLFKYIYRCTTRTPRARYARARVHGFKRGGIYSSRGGGSIPRLYTRHIAPPAARQQYRQRCIIFYNSIIPPRGSTGHGYAVRRSRRRYRYIYLPIELYIIYNIIPIHTGIYLLVYILLYDKYAILTYSVDDDGEGLKGCILFV